MARVFLSYARDDCDAASQLAEAIGRAGHEVWWDRHIQGGSRFATEIDRALKDAEAVVVLWTVESIQSDWVQDEAAEGRDSGRLVPVSLGACKPPLGFRQYHAIDFGDWDGRGEPARLGDLIQSIAKTAGAEKAAQAPAPARDQRQARGGPSICVLPFINMSGDAEQEYFSDGISEDVITDLSKVSSLSVIARHTAFTFKNKELDVSEVARTLNVSHVLEGSVRKAGGRVRVTAQLIDGKAGDHVWADRYDRDLTDIFAIQDEISKAIVGALKLKLLPGEKKAIENRGTASVDAYNLYLLARQYWIDGSFCALSRDEAVVRLCRQATLLDPDYAQAWALMALAQAELKFWHGQPVDALPAAERALAINPDLPEPHCVKARIVEEQGREAEATDLIETALRLGPDSWEVNREAARLIFRQGRIRDAIPFFEKAVGLMSTDFHNSAMLITSYTAIGDKKSLDRAARTTLERTQLATEKDPTNGAALAMGAVALAILGDEKRAKDLIERALVLDPDNLSVRYNLACVLAAHLHDDDAALDVLQLFFEQVHTATQIKHLEADPDFASVRDRPRFRKMLAAAKGRLGIAEQGSARLAGPKAVGPASRA